MPGSSFLQQDREVEPGRPAADDRDRSRERLREPIELVELGHGREEDELVAAGLLVAADEVLDRAGARQVAAAIFSANGPVNA